MKDNSYWKDFPAITQQPERLIYLDSGATTLKPQSVVDAVVDFYTKYTAPIGRSYYKNALHATELLDNSRRTMAEFLSADSSEIVFTQNCTDSINLIAETMSFSSTDEIILCKLNHHSCILPFMNKAKIIFVNTTENGMIDLDHLKKITNRNTKLIAITHVSNVLGNIQPVKKIVEIARSFGSLTLVDAAQSVGHFMIDVKEIDCDFLTLSAHKVLGPSGVGVLYGKLSVLNSLNVYRKGGGMINEFNSKTRSHKSVPYCFEAGTPNIEGIIGFGAALNYIEEIGISNISSYLNLLDNYFYNSLEKSYLIGYLLPINKYAHEPIFTFSLDENIISNHDIGTMLSNNFNISVNTGKQCSNLLHEHYNHSKDAMRVSLHIYNTEADIDKFFAAMEEIKPFCQI